MDVLLAERLHWTLDYIEGLPAQDYYRVWYVLDGLDMGRNHEQIRAAERARNR